MKIPAYFSLVLIFLGCATPNVLLVHPRSGDMVECSSVGLGAGALVSGSYVEDCVKQYEAVGFIPAEKLTPEEKANITPGRFIRNRQDFIPSGNPPPLPNFGTPQKPAGLNLLCQDAIARGDRGAMMVHCQ